MNRDPSELKITAPSDSDGASGEVIFDEREPGWFRYMVPLDTPETLLLTVWEGGAAARVLFIKGKSARVVMNESSQNDWPEPSGDQGTIMLHRGRKMIGNFITPTSTELWQWNDGNERFELKATVPYERRYSELARLLEQSKPN